jgi:hypothetical protein
VRLRLTGPLAIEALAVPGTAAPVIGGGSRADYAWPRTPARGRSSDHDYSISSALIM